MGTGYFAQANGFPLYVWFSTSTNVNTGAPVYVDSFYIADATNITVTAYSDFGTTMIGTPVAIPNVGTTPELVTLNLAGVEQLSFTGGGGEYINNIKVNENTVSVPGPIVGAGLPGIVGMFGFGATR